MTDAVNGVQSFKQWRAELPAEEQSKPAKQLRKLYREYKAKANPDAGVKVEKSDAQPLSEEKKAKKAESQSKQLKEIEKMKAYAQEHKADKAGVGKNIHLTVNDDLSPDTHTLYGNNKELKDELLQLFMESEIPSKEELEKTYGKDIAKALNPVLEEAEYRKTHFATHDTYVNRKDYRTDKREQLKDGAERSDIKENNTLVKNSRVKDFIQRNFMTSDGRVDTQSLKDFVTQYVGTDFEVNYGIHKKHNGGIGQDEYRMAMDDTGLNRRQVRKLVEAAGGFSEKSDKLGKVVLAGLGGAGIGSLLGSAFGSAISATASAHASAHAEIIDTLGNVLAEESAEDFKSAVQNLAASGAGLGAIIGGITAMGTTALAYHYDGKRDIMNGFAVEQAVAEPSLMLKGIKKPKDIDRVPVVMVEALKSAGVPDDEIVHAIKLAKGNASGTNVNLNELVSACRMLEEKYKDKDIAQPVVEEPVKVKTETVKPEITAEKTQKTFNEEVEIKRYRYERKPGEYWFGIVKNMYETEDGKAISNADASKQASALKKAYGIAAKSADMPDVLDLDLTIEVDGKKYKLKNVDPSKIQRIISKEKSDGKTIKAERKDKTTTENRTYYGYEASAKVDGEVKDKRVESPDTKKYTEEKVRDAALEQAKKELEEAHPPFERKVE